MATKYDNWKDVDLNLNNVGTLYSQGLQPGQYVAWGRQPSSPASSAPSNIVTNMPQITNAPLGIPTSQVRRGNGIPLVSRASLSPINIPAIARPQDNIQVNPTGDPMTGTQAMLRGQALRGEGMSVAQRKALQGQIASEAGSIEARQRRLDLMDEERRKQRDELEKRGLVGQGLAGKMTQIEAQNQAKASLQVMKNDAVKAREEYKQAQISGRQDQMIQARDKWLDTSINARLEEDRLAGKNVFSAEWREARKQEMMAQGMKDESALNKAIYNATESLVSKGLSEGFIGSYREAKQIMDDVEKGLSKTSPESVVSGNASQDMTDANANGVPDSLESDYNALDKALQAEKSKEVKDAALILKIQDAMKKIKGKLLPR